MEIFSITRARFAKKTDKCVSTHTLNFADEKSADSYTESMMRLDGMINAQHPPCKQKSWQYTKVCKDVY